MRKLTKIILVLFVLLIFVVDPVVYVPFNWFPNNYLPEDTHHVFSSFLPSGYAASPTQVWYDNFTNGAVLNGVQIGPSYESHIHNNCYLTYVGGHAGTTTGQKMTCDSPPEYHRTQSTGYPNYYLAASSATCKAASGGAVNQNVPLNIYSTGSSAAEYFHAINYPNGVTLPAKLPDGSVPVRGTGLPPGSELWGVTDEATGNTIIDYNDDPTLPIGTGLGQNQYYISGPNHAKSVGDSWFNGTSGPGATGGYIAVPGGCVNTNPNVGYPGNSGIGTVSMGPNTQFYITNEQVYGSDAASVKLGPSDYATDKTEMSLHLNTSDACQFGPCGVINPTDVVTFCFRGWISKGITGRGGKLTWFFAGAEWSYIGATQTFQGPVPGSSTSTQSIGAFNVTLQAWHQWCIGVDMGLHKWTTFTFDGNDMSQAKFWTSGVFTPYVDSTIGPVFGSGTTINQVTIGIAATTGVYNATQFYKGTSGMYLYVDDYSVTTSPTGAFDFSLSASPNLLSIQQGTSGSSTIMVASLNGFSGTVSLAASAPAGLTATLSSTSLAVTSGGSASSTLSIVVSSSTTAGTYIVTVAGTSGSLSHSTTVTVAVQTAPSAPQNLVATAGNAQVTLSWSAPLSNGGSSITNYKIYRGTVSGGETFLTTIGNVLTYNDTAVTNGITYYYQVTAVNSVGESAKSNEAIATPKTTPAQSVSVTTDKGSYRAGSTVEVTVTVSSSGVPVAGATVTLTIIDPTSSTVSTQSGFTDSSGTVLFTYLIPTNAVSGWYTVKATASATDHTSGSGSTTFKVR